MASSEQKDIKNKQALLKSKCSPKALVKVMEMIKENEVLMKGIDAMGFISLKHLQPIQMDFELIRQLLDSFDLNTCSVSGFKIKAEDVASILGVPAGTNLIPTLSNDEQQKFKTKFKKSSLPSLTNDIVKFKDVEEVDLSFKETFMLFSLGHFFCPTTSEIPSVNLYRALSILPRAREYNWAQFILDFLLEGIKEYQKKTRGAEKIMRNIGICGCTFFLKVFFLQKMDPLVVESGMPIFSAWTSEKIRLASKKNLTKKARGPPEKDTKSEFLEAIENNLQQRTSLVSSDNCRFCNICGGQYNGMRHGDANFVDKDKVNDIQRKQEELESSFKETKQQVQQAHLTWKQELDMLVNHTKSLEVAASSYHRVLEENRLLRNQVLDLKGTIRVYCRVKPVASGPDDAKSTVEYIGENGDILIVNPHKQGKDSRRIYSFNKVFGGNTTQQQIYVDTQPLIRSVLDGYNVCIFAYGQTGSGKTYTMSGPDLTTQETWGVNYRALRDLFEISKERANAIEYEVGVQMIEIYNEQVRDLLVTNSSNRRLEIRNNSQLNGLNVPDASLVPVKCPHDVLDLMEIGLKNCVIGETALNVRSSRSHSILTIHVRGKDLVSGSILKSCLHLVDLAGSERVDKSEAIGERLKEAQHINRSLSALGDVIAALAQKSTHIPYRNSKLTQVLRESLGGHAKTLMFVHITPEVNAIGETISTLKFAERVGSIELGAARSNKKTGEIRDIKEEISHLKLALEKKEAELEQLRKTNLRGASSIRVPNITTSSLKPALFQRSVDNTKDSKIGCSSGRQIHRKYRLPSKFTDKDVLPKLSFLPEERSTCSGKPRSPSPPVRRSYQQTGELS